MTPFGAKTLNEGSSLVRTTAFRSEGDDFHEEMRGGFSSENTGEHTYMWDSCFYLFEQLLHHPDAITLTFNRVEE
ncbi:hypothetical protein NECAME_05466 [Necator americanus]|uniref:Uncharacterized protein n=1 Tax=Necator americanus TaxID=51031 RepID=W2SJ21_NECAM|nr:hypothetical protein NECAME_05466 [Necator americanus]ETN68742.1 hypothetical protein NECAME_05466 [Necator americanus]